MELNPLDRSLRMRAAQAHLSAARRQAMNGKLADAEQSLTAGQALCQEHVPVAHRALQSSLARKAGRAAEADDLRAQLAALPGGRLAGSLCLAVDAGLLKLKPADRKAANQALGAALADSIEPRDAILVYEAWRHYANEGISYRGQLTHEKKIESQLLHMVEHKGRLGECEELIGLAIAAEAWKLVDKLARKLSNRYPGSPLFPLALAAAELRLRGDQARWGPFANHLRRARQLIDLGNDPKHQEFLPWINELEEEFPPPSILDRMFGNL
jgi:hypothetical protein